jgi:hypothetical protein
MVWFLLASSLDPIRIYSGVSESCEVEEEEDVDRHHMEYYLKN